ncbi:hypothetical protein CGRA01v4_01852 [Colletotrichum graminicola]|nr:hypothetical protein CGRA01v4_01852 [Colletotrichum graminicola]
MYIFWSAANPLSRRQAVSMRAQPPRES